MNIRKWKDSPALKETRDMLEIKLEDKKVRGILNWIFQIAVVLIFGILAGIALFQSVTVQESTMEPTLQVGERFFVNRAVYKVSSPERGDIIVYKTSGSDDAALHIGRVIGLPGETVQISNGAVLINGEVYNENKNFPEISNAGLASDGVSLESGEYFVLGDNRKIHITIRIKSHGPELIKRCGKISIRNILWERYGLSFPRKINLDF